MPIDRELRSRRSGIDRQLHEIRVDVLGGRVLQTLRIRDRKLDAIPRGREIRFITRDREAPACYAFDWAEVRMDVLEMMKYYFPGERAGRKVAVLRVGCRAAEGDRVTGVVMRAFRWRVDGSSRRLVSNGDLHGLRRRLACITDRQRRRVNVSPGDRVDLRW